MFKFIDKIASPFYIPIVLFFTTIGTISVMSLKLRQDKEIILNKMMAQFQVEFVHTEILSFLRNERNCLSTFSHNLNNVSKLIKANGNEWINFQKEGEGQPFYKTLKIKSIKFNQLSENSFADERIREYEFIYYLNDFEEILVKKELFFFSFENKKLSTCLVSKTQGITDERPYLIKNDKVIINGKQLVLSQKKEESFNGSVFIEKGISFNRNKLGETCFKNHEGVLSLDMNGQLKFCKDQKWISFGSDNINWKQKKIYSVELLGNENKMQNTDWHKTCVLVSVIKKSKNDGCKLEIVNSLFAKKYRLTAFTTEDLSKVKCEALCVN